ncbi:uncharacterized protein LOC129778357 [Toxorhynchites rutilus septentrionalis]|uniref:uncharacterized protein LOC129778357 n=1 Tax=Toxorhynchites rutilus septentrionalis TaxID=329112 RepID=UPI0024785602|nr:uncharacterized protein LOC129778357 [Toxorhynchites rutilus septentrionalis]
MTDSTDIVKLSKAIEGSCFIARLDSSSSDEEGYVSPYCCSSDDDHDQHHRALLDELPVFSTQSLSPSGRSLSPIDTESFSPPRYSQNSSICDNSAYNTPFESPSQLGKDFVTLEEIHARIGVTPPDSERSRTRLNLETIFEGEFLETPPKKEFESRAHDNLLRRSFRNRVLFSSAMEVVPTESPSNHLDNSNDRVVLD